MTYTYQAPDRLEDDWRRGDKTPPDEMVEELRGDISNVEALVYDEEPLIPVQGRVSDYKSWLAAAVAVELNDAGVRTTVFSPQRTNRESAVFKLRQFGAELLEHPGRFDLCIWDFWRDNVGHVDRSTCESIGCPFYVDDTDEVAERAADAMGSHLMINGGRRDLDADTLKEMGRPDRQDACPAQLYLKMRGMEQTADLINVATYAKAFEDAAISDDDPLGSDALLLDEAHTVAADPEVVAEPFDPGSLLSSIGTVTDMLDGSADRWAQRAHRDLEELQGSLRRWLERSEDKHVEPNGVFRDGPMTLSDAFDTLDTVADRLLRVVRRATRREDADRLAELSGPYTCVEAVKGFLNRVVAYREGRLDFVHSLYEESGEEVNEMAFRTTDETVGIDGGTTPGAVFRQWQEDGTHPAIADRWGPILDRYIESLWDGRALQTTNELPGAPMMPLDRLREISGADSVVTLSATHNELSDPTRPPERARPTRHELLCAPVNLRAKGSDRRDYDGKDSVNPSTPWFRSMVEEAKQRSGDSLAAVPINYANASKWESLPVEELETDNGTVRGLVPNSRGAIGEKGLESMDIDTVACGVQVQSPAPTARRLVQWWEMLAPRRDDPAEVLEASWRLLAQHAVSGTIQAGGRFDWDAVNLVFERPGLFELAGFEVGEATPDSPGFAGEFCRLFERRRDEWADGRAAVRVAKIIGYLEGAERKSPTVRQTVGEFQRVYNADEQEARGAVIAASERGKIEAEETANGAKLRIR